MNTCAVIPAAGRGSRLGLDLPKLLVPVSGRHTIWSALKGNLRPYVDHIHVVLSPAGAPLFEQALAGDPDAPMVSISIQPEPIGMGDAIFRGYDCWSRATTVVVVWGDQVHVSGSTIQSSLDLHAGAQRRVVIPLVSLAEPYVEYRFDHGGRLARILQSREGDRCEPLGLGDVGTFLLSTGGLADQWQAFLAKAQRGTRTGEVNFLPFLVFLAEAGWDVRPGPALDPREARGINTPEDLDFFREVYREGRGTGKL
jgi:bifunctional UDP-N-acetylglucosamine pyrophosphorylase / glucosamine-1-phosphate N-acetyltransferase